MSEQKIRDFEKKIQLLKEELGTLYKSAEPSGVSQTSQVEAATVETVETVQAAKAEGERPRGSERIY